MIFFFFFNDTATTEIYTLSLHDALPICLAVLDQLAVIGQHVDDVAHLQLGDIDFDGQRARIFLRVEEDGRSEEHTSELQSRLHLVCRLLLEKKKQRNKRGTSIRTSHPCVSS